MASRHLVLRTLIAIGLVAPAGVAAAQDTGQNGGPRMPHDNMGAPSSMQAGSAPVEADAQAAQMAPDPQATATPSPQPTTTPTPSTHNRHRS